MRVDPTAGTGGEVMSDAGTIIGVHFPGRRLRLFTFCDDQRSESLRWSSQNAGLGAVLRCAQAPLAFSSVKTALCLDGGRVWDAEVSQVQLNIGLYAKSSYRGFLVAPYDSVSLFYIHDNKHDMYMYMYMYMYICT